MAHIMLYVNWNIMENKQENELLNNFDEITIKRNRYREIQWNDQLLNKVSQ